MAKSTTGDNDSRAYNDPHGTESSIGTQFRVDYYQKKALIEMKKEQYFSQLADVVSMPKHFGKTIKRYHYMPLLSDANHNDQGIDAMGIIGDGTEGEMLATIGITAPTAEGNGNGNNKYLGERYFANGYGADAAAAQTEAEADAASYLLSRGFTGVDYTALQGAAQAAGWWVDDATYTPVPYGGNLYGSSKDAGVIASKLPVLSEHGGRVNRVGFRRIELQGSIEKFGFFDEYTQESMDFDTDAELQMHIHREMLMGANEITEDSLQLDLLNGAGVVRYGGVATQKSEMTGEDPDPSVIDYEDLMRLAIDLDNNRTPKHTKMIVGSRMIDTRTIDAARFLYVGSELIPMLKKMTDLHGNPAFIPVYQYADAGNPKTTNVGTGEIGAIDQFRIIVVPEMMHWAGAGDTVVAANQYHATNGQFDVFPMLCIGSESFTTIGFQTDGKTVKFKITHKKPGKDIASRDDPYGEVGFMSIKWYYGCMILRPERLAVCLTVAEL